MDRAVILGASRGLGAKLAQYACGTTYPVMGFGRKKTSLQTIRDNFPLFEYQVADFATADGQERALSYLREAQYNKVFCVAGGGPYGRYGEREWKDHEWSWEVSFLFPARVIHTLLKAHRLEQLIVIGSSVAEAEPDPMAASYCAAKHALKGLVTSVQAESLDWDIRLFSPGYMDTELLPKNAAVRKLGVYEPAQIAQELWTWSLTADKGANKLYPKHPS